MPPKGWKKNVDGAVAQKASPKKTTKKSRSPEPEVVKSMASSESMGKFASIGVSTYSGSEGSSFDRGLLVTLNQHIASLASSRSLLTGTLELSAAFDREINETLSHIRRIRIALPYGSQDVVADAARAVTQAELPARPALEEAKKAFRGAHPVPSPGGSLGPPPSPGGVVPMTGGAPGLGAPPAVVAQVPFQPVVGAQGVSGGGFVPGAQG